MQNFSAIRPAVRRPFQKNSWGVGCTLPMHCRGLIYVCLICIEVSLWNQNFHFRAESREMGFSFIFTLYEMMCSALSRLVSPPKKRSVGRIISRVETSKLSYRAHRMLIRMFLACQTDFKWGKMFCLQCFWTHSLETGRHIRLFCFSAFFAILVFEYCEYDRSLFLVKSFRMSIRWTMYDNVEFSTSI